MRYVETRSETCTAPRDTDCKSGQGNFVRKSRVRSHRLSLTIDGASYSPAAHAIAAQCGHANDLHHGKGFVKCQ
jgi:hypothetical protein